MALLRRREWTQILLTILFVHVECKDFKIGVLSFEKCCYTTFALETSGSAITIALEQLRKDGLLVDHTISVATRPSRIESSGVANVVDLVQNEHVDVIFGSPASSVSIPAAHLTSHWNFPQVSWVSTSPVLTDKARFRTYVRTAGPFSKAGRAFTEVFRTLGWKRMGFVMRDSGLCQYAADAIKITFPEANITIAQNIGYPADYTLTTQTVDGYMKRLKESARIIYLCDGRASRLLLKRACAMGMCNGDYVFLMPWAAVGADFHKTRMWMTGDDDDPEVMEASKHLLYITLGKWNSEASRIRLEQFNIEVIRKMAEPPWNNPYALENNLTTNAYAPFLYNAMYFYGLWLNHSLATGIDHQDGMAMFNFSNGLSFDGIDGPMEFDNNGDRNPLYWIWDFKGNDGYPTLLASVRTGGNADGKSISEEGWVGFRWLTPSGDVPKDTPDCGFHNEFCPPEKIDTTPIVVASSLTVVALIFVSGTIVYIVRKRQIESNMMKMIWKVGINEIEMRKSRTTFGSMKSVNSTLVMSRQSLGSRNDSLILPTTTVGIFRGQLAFVKTINKHNIAFSRSDLLELKEMREMSHNNINPFLGACLDFPGACVLFMFCPKGSLQDILENDDIKLDMLFKNSLTMDLVEGVYFLHSSALGSHGRLKSTNCLVDNRWVLKISDYGVGRFLDARGDSTTEEHQKYKSLLWTAPELMTLELKNVNGTKEGDIYGFGIILHEIFYRMGTFAGKAHMTAKDIIGRVRNREVTPCRPEIFEDIDTVGPAVTKLMQLCWLDHPKDRPNISTVKAYTKKNIHGVGKNIVDVMLQRLEAYASNLEDVVDQRTQQLLEEKDKTDKLLYRMLPASCAEKLKAGEIVEPEVYDSVTVFFSDIVGFTSIAAVSSPMEVVNLLNDLYTLFDAIIAKYDAYKVETIGDAYLVVSGLPSRNGNRHVAVIADMSLNILAAIRGFRIQHLPERKLKVRIGMHTGPCCAGVVGLSMPRFCLFGDTVNTASRMESNGLEQRIHMSEASHLALEVLGGYSTSFRGEMPIKGKGMMSTYWLDGKGERHP